VRWQQLFADLEAQVDALERAERSDEVAERTRSEFAAVTAFDRYRAAGDQAVRLGLPGGLAVVGRIVGAAPEWLLIDEGEGREVLVATAALVTVRGLGREAGVPDGAGVVATRLGLRVALRGLARDRSGVRLHLRDGAVLDATIDRVGADFVEVALHPPDEPRRQRDVRETGLVPFSALAAMRRRRND
jgi:hypothetical protein